MLRNKAHMACEALHCNAQSSPGMLYKYLQGAQAGASPVSPAGCLAPPRAGWGAG